MRDGLPAIAFVVGCVALIVALAGAFGNSRSVQQQAPEEVLRQTMAQLASVEEKRKAAREDYDRLRRDVIRALESRSAQSLDIESLRNVVRREVDAALQQRFEQELRGAVPAQPQPQASATSSRREAFDAMFEEARSNLNFGNEHADILRKTLEELRYQLNAIYRRHGDGEIDEATRLSLAQRARAAADKDLTEGLGSAAFRRFASWRRSSDNEYVKNFFGL